MLSAGASLSIRPDTDAAAREAAECAMTRAQIGRADLALVFATCHHGSRFHLLLRRVSELVGTRNVVGCSGMGVLTTDGEVERSPGVAVMVMQSDALSVRRFFVPQLRGREEDVAREIVTRLHSHLAEKNLLLVFPDTYNLHPAPFLTALHEGLGAATVVGGGASEDGSVGETFQMCGDTYSSNAVSGVLLAGSFFSTIGIAQAAQPVGEPCTVTKAQGNVIWELDGQPAFDIFARVVRPPLLRDLKRAAAFVFVGLPVDPDKQRIAPGEYLVRNIIGIDSRQKALAIGDTVCAGQKIVFTLRDGNRAREDLKLTLAGAVERWQGMKPRLGLYFNCLARGSSLYGVSDLDTAYITRYIGDIPLIGFFTGCEIAPIRDTIHLHQYSGVLVLISEDAPPYVLQ